ncbi:hypothetical protein ROTO_29270 [Roseovarius tolerans]|uniref:DUF3726 domain-containing protein n=1 Tax=Roseovarius tolerans TaxID=74031 RepID=A0A0L6CRZ0_9RHOB|nr:DUF3726 domain-containing protein [Roseovarius tolerans]KNX40532.1 hypothetical protein ROTO_29270 [Roseovarius tolerans]
MMSPNDPTRSASAPVAQDGARVCLSLSEINALCFKAARGSGLTWGEAEEAGWAAAWLTRAGLAGPSILLNWLKECDGLSCPMPEAGRWAARMRPLCPLRTGIALADHAGLPEGPGEDGLQIDSVAHPRLILPFVARAATRLDLPLRIGWVGAELTLDTAANGPITVSLGEDAGAPVDLWIAVVARPEPNEQQTDCAVPTKGIAFADWQALDALALRVTVPPSAGSRAGAGDAGDDND